MRQPSKARCQQQSYTRPPEEASANVVKLISLGNFFLALTLANLIWVAKNLDDDTNDGCGLILYYYAGFDLYVPPQVVGQWSNSRVNNHVSCHANHEYACHDTPFLNQIPFFWSDRPTSFFFELLIDWDFFSELHVSPQIF